MGILSLVYGIQLTGGHRGAEDNPNNVVRARWRAQLSSFNDFYETRREVLKEWWPEDSAFYRHDAFRIIGPVGNAPHVIFRDLLADSRRIGVVVNDLLAVLRTLNDGVDVERDIAAQIADRSANYTIQFFSLGSPSAGLMRDLQNSTDPKSILVENSMANQATVEAWYEKRRQEWRREGRLQLAA